ncbi:ATP-dependent RNA helicase DbpA [Motiliproteus sp. SC1-56]|uniref:ATP-dependent RNA helicase DbpA n=1 Tax=Motiliproteus sp. SC1-56 TaxID=2799565 RepID=UPI00351C4EE0
MAAAPFSTLPLPKPLLANLDDLGYRQMTPIQAKSLPLALENRDLRAQAETGSGKTAAFGLALLLKIKPRLFAPQGLVLCPTRELATQVARELRRLARYQDNIKVLTLSGGQPIGPQIGSLAHGAHLIVGTPGRVQDHLRKGTLKLDQLHTLVLDEADRMLDMGFVQSIEAIAAATPPQRQTLLFSATYPKEIDALGNAFQRDPAWVEADAVATPAAIEQRAFEVTAETRITALDRLLRHYQPAACVLFCNTKQGCRELTEALQGLGHSALALHGDLDQRTRDAVLTRFSHGSCALLVATDVAARGLDISELPAVINYELSRDPEVHTHRVGRTGRAGRTGLALSLFTESERYKLERLADAQGEPLAEADWESLSAGPPLQAARVDLCIAGGRKQKVRPGDILGALTGEAGLDGKQVGKISLFDHCAYVAVDADQAKKALGRLANGRIKGRRFKVRRA